MPAARPNIVLITTDQQRWDTCGPLAPSFMRTPHFDNLAREGITFSSAYADCPICVPSRVSIMTGKTVFAHDDPCFDPSTRFIDNATSLPGCLGDLGYQTIAVGKMHFEPQRARHGFQEMLLPEDYYRQRRASGHDLQPMRHGLGQNELYPGMATVPEALTLTSWISEQCVEFIRERRDPTAPFFMWCSYSKPHPPLDPPEPYYSMYRNCDIPEPVCGDWSTPERLPESMKRFWQSWSGDLLPAEIIREARAAYYGLITQCDYNMGRVLAALQDRGLLDDTLILYTTDHGEYLGDHHGLSKCYFHEPSAHLPFLLRLPKSWEGRQPGSTCAAPATLADVLPTLVSAAGGTAPEGCDGRNLLAVARGEEAPRPFVVATHNRPPHHSYLGITDGRYKYIWYPEGSAEQFFDLESDPRELHDLAGKPEVGETQVRLRAQMVAWLAEHGPQYLDEGSLPARPLAGDTETERRNHAWPGYHTEGWTGDVRH